MFIRRIPWTTLMVIVFAVLIPMTGAEARNPIAPPGSRVALLAPVGYALATGFVGFRHESSGASIVITELKPGSMAAVRGTYGNTDGFSIRRLSHTELTTLPNPGFLSVFRSVEGRTPFRKWVLAFDAPALTGIVAINVPEAEINAAMEATIVAALASVTVVPDASGVGASTPPFHLGASSRLHPVATRDGTTIVFAQSSEREKGTRFTASAHLGGGPVLAPEDFTKRMAAATDGIGDIAVTETRAIAAGGVDGFEVTAGCVDSASGEPCVLYHAMLFGADGYFRFIGVANAARQGEALAEFRGLVQGFRRNP